MGARSSRSRGPGLRKTDGHLVEYYRDSFGAGGGAALAPTQLIASGGTTLTDGGYKYHVFTTSGAFSVTSGESSDFEVLVVGGGGSGGSQHGGGGGAGGVVYNTQQSVSTVNPGPYSVAIGAGGPAPAGPYTSEPGVNGSDSQFGSPGDPIYIIAKGGSYGGGYQVGGGSASGASGGGAGGNGGPRQGGSANAPSTSPSIANTTDSGGKSYQNDAGDCPGSAGSGGGGAGGVGGDAPSGSGGNGGNGQAFPGFPGPGIYNAAPPSLQTTLGTTWRDALGPTGLFGGGGGGGGHLTPSAGGPGGPGGGGAGGRHVPGGSSDVGENGVAYTGGGGGGSGANDRVMGTGGTGIVIVRYLI